MFLFWFIAQRHGRLFGTNYSLRRQYHAIFDSGAPTLYWLQAGRLVATVTAETLVARDGLEITLGGHTQLYHRYTGLFRCDNEEEAERLYRFLLDAIAQFAIPPRPPVDEIIPVDVQEATMPPVEEDGTLGGVPITLEVQPLPSGPGLPAVIPRENGGAHNVNPVDVQEANMPPVEEDGTPGGVPIPLQVLPLPPVPPRLAELPGFVDEWRTGHMSPTEAKRMFCTLFAAYIVRVTGNPNHQDRYNEMINGSVVDTDKLTQIDKKCIIEPGPAAQAVMSHF